MKKAKVKLENPKCVPQRFSNDPEDYNAAPIGFRKITEEEFAQSRFFTYGTHRPIQHKQILMENREPALSVMLFHQAAEGEPQEGFGISHDYWAGKVLYFAFGCDHKFKEIAPNQPFRCWHTYQCQVPGCGKIESHDSSD